MPPGSKPGERRGGRQKGTPNKATTERLMRAQTGLTQARETGVMPLDVMLARMRDEPLPNGQKATAEQFQAAVAAAPYVHPRLSAVAVREITPVDPAAAEKAAEAKAAMIRLLDEMEASRRRTIEYDAPTEPQRGPSQYPMKVSRPK